MAQMQGIEDWLREKKRRWPIEYMFGFLGVLGAGLLALGVTFLLLYVALFFGLFSIFPSEWERISVTLGIIALLFLANVFYDRRQIERLKVDFLGGGKHYVGITIPYVGSVSNVNWFSTDTMHSFARIWIAVLLTGPRLVTESFQLLGKSRRLGAIDVEGCAAVLAALVHKDGKMSLEELAELLPDSSDPVKVFTELQEIYGVMLLRSEPISMTLFTDLRNELRHRMPRKKKRKRPKESDVIEEWEVVDDERP